MLSAHFGRPLNPPLAPWRPGDDRLRLLGLMWICRLDLDPVTLLGVGRCRTCCRVLALGVIRDDFADPSAFGPAGLVLPW